MLIKIKMVLHVATVVVGVLFLYLFRNIWTSWTVHTEEVFEDKHKPEEVKGSEITKETQVKGPFMS